MVGQEPQESYTRRSSDDRLLDEGPSEDDEFFPEVEGRGMGSVDYAPVRYFFQHCAWLLRCNAFAVAEYCPAVITAFVLTMSSEQIAMECPAFVGFVGGCLRLCGVHRSVLDNCTESSFQVPLLAVTQCCELQYKL